MGNVIPWSEIHPSIRSEEPFVAVVIVDPQRQICISELVPFEEQSMHSPEVAAQEMIGAVQAAARAVGGRGPGRQRLSGAAQRRAHAAGAAGRRRAIGGQAFRAKEPFRQPADHVALPGGVSRAMRCSSRDLTAGHSRSVIEKMTVSR